MPLSPTRVALLVVMWLRCVLRFFHRSPNKPLLKVYLLQRVSNIVRAQRQLVAFSRVYLDAGESRDVLMDLEVDRYLPIVNRQYVWELETG